MHGFFYTFDPNQNILNEITFYSLSSGSSGNCYYLGNESGGILIDAGISATSIRKFLKDIDVQVTGIMGILITHNHVDHIRGLEVLTRKHNIPVFTTERIWKSIYARKVEIPACCKRIISKQERFKLVDFDIEAFPVSHDAPETVGFHFSGGEKYITIATDLGYISETVASYIRKANLLVIESNYDEEMLAEGRYPFFLKTRISSENGHLSNTQTSEFMADNISDKLRHICLAHLSINNNSPEKALSTLKQTLLQKGIGINGRTEISVLNRNKPSEMINLT